MSSSSKRKAGTSIDSELRKKRLKNGDLRSFFSPQVTVRIKSSDGATKHSSVALNPEQTRVLRMVVNEGKNVFFTGAAGTGKSLLLAAIIANLQKKYSQSKDTISITASTGMAASNIGGTTIHSWGAVTPNSNNMQLLTKCIKACSPALQRWRKTKVLVIDEVSMVDGQLFQVLHDLAVQLRKPSPRPFGGIQIVVTGDFFQLPPVTKNSREPIFAFESRAWQSTFDTTVELKNVFRQKDHSFISALNALRLGAPTDECVTLFNSLIRPLPSSTILPTELFPLRAQVAQANASRLSSLPTESVPYGARDSGNQLRLLDNLLAEEQLNLKVGAQVMLIKNFDEVLVNGIVGRVLGFYHPFHLIASTTPFSPLTQAHANTAAKKNGSLLRYVELSEDKTTPIISFEAGRKRNKENTELNSEQKEKAAELYPLVRFEYPLQDGSQAIEAVLVRREEFKVEDAEGKLLARRVQLPLILAWAVSIHKSQGQTIHQVKVDLTNVFERGQSYVALSRASSLKGLQVLGFNPRKVVAHPKVLKWYNDTLSEDKP